MIGARWLNRVGAIIVLLAVAFFVKYSFDQGWLSPAVRCLFGAATGLGLIAAGEFSLRRRMEHFAVGLLGAGVAALYLSVLAAHHLFALVSTEFAFGLYCLITAGSTLIAIHGRIQAVAILAVIGGFLTPIALSTGRDAQVELMTYLFLLDLGFLIAAAVRRWEGIRFLCWLGTAGLFAGWALQFYRPEAFDRTLGFLLAFYAMFWLEALSSSRRAYAGRIDLILRFRRLHTAVFFAAAYALVHPLHPEWTGLLALLAGLAQWAAAMLVRPFPARAEPFRESLWIDGAILLALAAPLQFDGYSTVVGWTVQALVCLMAARRVPDGWLRVAAPLLFALAFGHLQVYELRDAALLAPIVGNDLWRLNRVVLLFVGVGLAACAGSAILGLRRALLPADSQVIGLLAVMGTAAMLFVFAHQFDRHASTWAWLLVAGGWVLAARAIPAASVGAMALALVIAGKLIGWDLVGSAVGGEWRGIDGLILNRAMLSAALVTALLGTCIPIAARLPAWSAPDDAHGRMRSVLVLAMALVLVAACTFEIVRSFRFDPLRERFGDPRRAMHFFLSTFWSVAALAMLALGFAGRQAALRYLAIGLFGLVVAKVMLVDISHLGMVYRIFSFLVVGLLLIAASWLYQKLSARVLAEAAAS